MSVRSAVLVEEFSATWLLTRNETAERPSATASARSGLGTGVFVWERGGSRKCPDMMTSNRERHVCLKFLSTIHSIACGRRGHVRDVGAVERPDFCGSAGTAFYKTLGPRALH